jgi:sugar/nucleoside kinase (ribokinase family)
MHGTLSPDTDFKNRYIYPSPDFERQPENSIVISESDYDECLKELKDIPESPLLKTLENPCLIIGKSFTWQDLSFLYALRATREKRNKRAYMITPSLALDEELNLENLGIQPLVINMPVPSMREDGHFYVGFVKALLELFPKYREIYNQQIVDFAYEQNLIRAPHFVTLGLAAHNTLGRMQYFGDIGDRKNPKYILPSEGRRNLRLEAKDYAGGPALTALGVFASLDWEKKYQPSIISTVGNDIYKQVVLDFCKQFRIDVDGLSETASNTWQSTVLIHESRTHDKKIYPGQRIFLDRGFEKPLFLSKGVEEQFEAQLDHTQPNLRLVYFDKFLALPYPFNPDEMNREGLLMKNEYLLEEIITDREDVDILYETGGGGSQRLIVEKRLGKYINIFTAGFPFFVRNILSHSTRKAHRGLDRFSQDDWFQAEFGEETLAIERIFEILKVTPFEERKSWFVPPSDWIVAGKERVGRKHNRRWLVVTLHHYGALAIDLNAEKAWYCSIPFDAQQTQNTAGAGDVFRGAFCYALLRFGENSQKNNTFEDTLLLNCTKFANKIAFEKCAVYDMNDAYQMMGSFSKKYLPS